MRSVFVVVLGLSGCQLVFQLDGPCVGEACLTTLAEEPGATEILAAGPDVFWLTRNEVRTCAIEACEPITIAPDQSEPHGLLVDGDHVLFAVDNEMRWVARDGSGPIRTWHDDSFSNVEDFLRRDNLIWWSSAISGLTLCEYDSAEGTCEFSSSGNETSSVSGALATDPSGRLWAVAGDRVVEIDTVAVTIAKSFPLDRPQLLATSSSHVFATAGAQVLAWLQTAEPEVAPQPVLETAVPIAMQTTGEFLYVADGNGTIGRLRLVGLDAPAQEVATELPGLRGLSVESGRIFVIAADRISVFSEP